MTFSPHTILPKEADRLVVVFSDIEMGAGGNFDDFPHSDFLGELILSYNEAPFAPLPVDLVFNGDTFDLLKTSYLDTYPHHVTGDVALGKMARIAAAHPRFFEAMRSFLGHPGAERNVWFVVGNHDFELLFPQVQTFLRSLCGHDGQVHFPGFAKDFGRVHIEHGSQADTLFHVDPNTPFAQHEGRQILNLPWGSVALLDVMMPLQSLLHFHDRLVPRKVVMDLMPEVKELVVESFWKYWTRDYWKGFLRAKDPMKRMTWTMLKEVGSRLLTKDAEVSVGDHYIKQMRTQNAYELYLVGHLHEAGWWSYGSRKVLQNGCFRNEYMVLDDGKHLKPLAKSYTEVLMNGDEPIRSQLVEVQGPPAPPGYIPESIFNVLPAVRQMLLPPEEIDQTHQEQEEQEAREAKEAKKQARQRREDTPVTG